MPRLPTADIRQRIFFLEPAYGTSAPAILRDSKLIGLLSFRLRPGVRRPLPHQS